VSPVSDYDEYGTEFAKGILHLGGGDFKDYWMLYKNGLNNRIIVW